MDKTFIKILAVIILITSFIPLSNVFAEVYSKPEFRGRVSDVDTKQPIEGAVVVVLYHKRSTFSLNPGGTSAYVTKAKETLTDKKGEFYFPSYSEAMFLNEDVGTQFIFFKPGYMSSYGPTNIKPALIEKYFSADEIGKEAEIEGGTFEQGSYVKWKGILGIMELKKAKTYEDRRKTRPTRSDLKDLQLPIFTKVLEDEYKHLYNEK